MTDVRAPIFDAVRKARGGAPFSQMEVAQLDDCLDRLKVPVAAAAPLGEEFMAAAIDHLRREEGVMHKAYKDHLGYWTIGVGRLIDERKGGRITADEEARLVAKQPARLGKPWRDWVLTDEEVDMLLAADIDRFVKALQSHSGLRPAWQAVQGNTARMVALLSMAFQMGEQGLAGFRNSLGLVAQGKFQDAASNMLLSTWAKQTPARAKRVTDMIATGRLK